MNSLGRMYPNLSASELSSIILKGKHCLFKYRPFSVIHCFLHNHMVDDFSSKINLNHDFMLFCNVARGKVLKISLSTEGTSPPLHITWAMIKRKKIYKVIRLHRSRAECNYNFSKNKKATLRWNIIIIYFLQCHVVVTINDLKHFMKCEKASWRFIISS